MMKTAENPTATASMAASLCHSKINKDCQCINISQLHYFSLVAKKGDPVGEQPVHDTVGSNLTSGRKHSGTTFQTHSGSNVRKFD